MPAVMIVSNFPTGGFHLESVLGQRIWDSAILPNRATVATKKYILVNSIILNHFGRPVDYLLLFGEYFKVVEPVYQDRYGNQGNTCNSKVVLRS